MESKINTEMREILQSFVDLCEKNVLFPDHSPLQDILVKAKIVLAKPKSMSIDITDNRQEWLINLGEEYARATQQRFVAEEAFRRAREEQERIAGDIARIGGYILEAKGEVRSSSERRTDGESITRRKGK